MSDAIETPPVPAKKRGRPPGILTQSHPRKRKFSKFQDRLQQIEAALANCVPEPQITRSCAKQFGVSENMVRQYIAEVRQRWREDSSSSGGAQREAKRDLIRVQLQTVVMRAFTRTVTRAGITTPDPDLRAATVALRELKNLDGLDEAKAEAGGNSPVSQFNVGLNFGPLGFKSPEEIRENLKELRAKFAEGGPAAFHGHVSQPPAEGPEELEEPEED